MSPESVCPPLEVAQSQELVRFDDVAIMNWKVSRAGVFTRLRAAGLRFARLSPRGSTFEVYRGKMTLDPKFGCHVKAWPVRTAMRCGLPLGPEVGLPTWEAENALEGLIEGDPDYVNLVARVLEKNEGLSLELPGDKIAVIVGERHFRDVVRVEEPLHVCGPPVLV